MTRSSAGSCSQSALRIKYREHGPSFLFLPLTHDRKGAELGGDEGPGQVQVAAHRVHERDFGVRRDWCSAPPHLDDPPAALRLDMGVPEACGALCGRA